MEGWSAASLRASVLSAAVLRYQDLKAGNVVEGEVAAVESFGLLVKLGEGVRALVPKIHLGDVTVKNPKSRFKASQRLCWRFFVLLFFCHSSLLSSLLFYFVDVRLSANCCGWAVFEMSPVVPNCPRCRFHTV